MLAEMEKSSETKIISESEMPKTGLIVSDTLSGVCHKANKKQISE